MSRIGKLPVPVPDGVTVSVKRHSVAVEGPKGKIGMSFDRLVSVKLDEESRQLTVAPRRLRGAETKAARRQQAIWGTTRKLLANMIEGVTRGYAKQLQIVGVGYAAQVEGRSLLIRCGFSNQITVPIPEGITVAPPAGDSLMISGVGQLPCTTLTIEGVDKQLVGQFAAAVRAVRPPEPYKGKGIRYMNEDVKRKAGKALAAGTT